MSDMSWHDAERYPSVRNVSQTEGGDIVLALWIGGSLIQFQGHFPSQPILPGVAQLDWAVHYAQKHLEITCLPKQITQLKFRNILTPDQEVELSLSNVPAKTMTKFSYQSGDVIFSSGNIKWDV